MSDIQELAQFRDYLSLRVQPGTVDVYVNALQLWFASISSSNGDGLTPEAAQSYVDLLAREGKSPSTVSTRAHAIMRYFRWKGQSIHLDCPTIRMKEPEYLSMEQIKKVIASCISVLERTLVVVLFDTAVRISELLNLKLNDIDRSGGFISVVRKGGGREEVNISEKALDELETWIRVRRFKSERVFLDFVYYDAWRVIKKIGERAGISLHPHIFRHSRAIQMIMSGASLHTVQTHLGHRSINTTASIYGRFRAVDIKESIPGWGI